MLKFHGSDSSCLVNKSLHFRLMNRLLKSNVSAFLILSSEEKQNFVLSGYPELKSLVFLKKITISMNKENICKYGIHTINAADDMIVVDGKKWTFHL